MYWSGSIHNSADGERPTCSLFCAVSLPWECSAQAEELAAEGRQVSPLVESLHPTNPVRPSCIRFWNPSLSVEIKCAISRSQSTHYLFKHREKQQLWGLADMSFLMYGRALRKWQPTPIFLPGKSHGGAWLAAVQWVTKRHGWVTKQRALIHFIFSWIWHSAFYSGLLMFSLNPKICRWIWYC